MANLLSGIPTADPTYTSVAQPYQQVSPQAPQVPQAPIAAVNVGENLSGAPSGDMLQITGREEGRKGPVKKIKGFIANIKKAFATAGTYIGGATKGLGRAAVGASVIFTGGELINAVNTRKAVKAATQGIEDVVKKGEAAEAAKAAVKKVPNKALAVAAGVLALGASLWTASLDATERRSEIEHRWTGHKQ